MSCKAGGTQSQKHFVSNHIALKINLKQNYSWPAQNETMIYNSISLYIRVWQFNSTSVIRTTFEVEFIINAHLHCIFEPYEQGQISSPCNYLHFGFTRNYDVKQLQDGFKEELDNELEDWKNADLSGRSLEIGLTVLFSQISCTGSIGINTLQQDAIWASIKTF